MKIVTEGISALRSEVSTFSGKIDSISDTLRGLAASVDNIQGQMNSLHREFGEVTQRCANLESRLTTVEDSNASLRASVEKLQAKSKSDLNAAESNQSHLRSDSELVVSGLDFPDSCTLVELFALINALFHVIGAVLPPAGVLDVFQLPKVRAGTPRRIIVRLSSPSIRNYVLSCKRQYKKSLRASEVQGAIGSSRVYINPNLPSDVYQLFKSARACAKDNGLGLKSVWVQKGRVAFRPMADGPVTFISGMDDLRRQLPGSTASTSTQGIEA